MWDLPRPGLEPVSPALAGGFLTTAQPGKSLKFLKLSDKLAIWKNPMINHFTPLFFFSPPLLLLCFEYLNFHLQSLFQAPVLESYLKWDWCRGEFWRTQPHLVAVWRTGEGACWKLLSLDLSLQIPRFIGILPSRPGPSALSPDESDTWSGVSAAAGLLAAHLSSAREENNH